MANTRTHAPTPTPTAATSPSCLRFLAAVRDYRHQHGYPPTLREVGLALAIESMGHLTYLRNACADRGWLTCNERRTRTMLLTTAGHRALAAEREARERQAHDAHTA